MRLQGRRIIVTGAASGQGAAIAKLFAEEGASLALLDLNGEGVRANAESLGVLAYPCDVADQAAVERCVSAAVEALGGLDGVVNAAGLYIKKLFTELDVDSFRRMQAVNLTGPYQLIRAALPALSKSGGATIV